MTKPYDYDQVILTREEFIPAREFMTIIAGSMAAGRQGATAIPESLQVET